MFKKINEELLKKEGYLLENERLLTNLVIESPEGKFIVVDNDFCHRVFNPNEEFFITVLHEKDNKISFIEKEFVMTEEILEPFNTTLKEYIHYFGIKDRVYINYQIFKETCQELKIDIEFPAWK